MRRWVWGPIAVLLIAGLATFQQELGSQSPSGDRIAAAESDVVVRVVDGDTVVLRSAGKSRLIGVDTPEVFGGRECFGREASAFAKRVLRPGLRVRVERVAKGRIEPPVNLDHMHMSGTASEVLREPTKPTAPL